MPKRIFLVALAALSLLAACNAGNVNDIYGIATATPGATGTPVPMPTGSTAVVYVSASASPLASQPVYLYPANAGGTAIATTAPGVTASPITEQTTNPSGDATFSNITPDTYYCFLVSYTPPAAGSLNKTQVICDNYWADIGPAFSF